MMELTFSTALVTPEVSLAGMSRLTLADVVLAAVTELDGLVDTGGSSGRNLGTEESCNQYDPTGWKQTHPSQCRGRPRQLGCVQIII